MAETKVTSGQLANDDMSKAQLPVETTPAPVAPSATPVTQPAEAPEVTAQKIQNASAINEQRIQTDAIQQQQLSTVKDNFTGEVAQTGGATVQAAQAETVAKAAISSTPGVTSASASLGVAPKEETVAPAQTIGTAPKQTAPKAGETTTTAPAKTDEEVKQTAIDKSKTAITGNKTSDELFADLQNMKFTYDSSTDAEYRQEASRLENDVAQMMVGRGMLYSSVAQSALQSRLIASQINFRKQAYDNWLQERSFMFNIVQYQAGREDAAFQKDMSIKQYNAGREDAAFSKKMSLANYALAKDQQAFSQSMQRQQLSLQKASASYQRKANELATASAANRKDLATRISVYSNDSGEYTRMKEKWEKNGVATPDVAAYFGVSSTSYGGQYGHTVGAVYSSSGNIIARKKDEIESYAKQIYNDAVKQKEDDMAMGYINRWIAEGEQETVQVNIYDPNLNNLGTSAQQKVYSQERTYFDSMYQDVDNASQSKIAAKKAYNEAVAKVDQLSRLDRLGPYLTQRLIAELADAAGIKG